MAAVTLLGSVTLTTASGTKTVTATPAVDDLIVIITAHSGNTSAAAPTDDQGGTYTQADAGAFEQGGVDVMRFWVRDSLIGSAASTVFTHAPGTSSGGGLAVLKITGMTRVGADAIKQTALQSNQASGATPAPVFGAAVLTTNPVIGAVFNNSTPAGMTARSSPAYTERADVGYNTPTTGLEVMSIDSGETGTTITWGSTSASNWCSFALELDASAAAADEPQSEGAPSFDADEIEDDWVNALDAAPVGEDAQAVADDPPSSDGWDHWVSDGWDHTAIPTVGAQVDATDPHRATPWQADDTDDDWYASLDAAPVGEDAVAVVEDQQRAAPWPEEASDDDWHTRLDAAPVADAQDPQDADAQIDDGTDDDWWRGVDSAPVGADVVVAQDQPPEGAPWLEEAAHDNWYIGLDASPVGADVIAAETPPTPDDFDHWVSDGWEHTAIRGSALQSDAAAAAAPDPDHGAPWPYAVDEAASLFDWMVIGEPIIEEDPRPEEDAPDYQTHDDDWWHSLDASPAGPDAPAAETPPILDDFDHWVSDGWDHTAVIASSLQSDAAAEPNPELPPEPAPWPYEVDESATLYDWMVIGEPIIEEDPQPENEAPDQQTFDDDWYAALDASPVGADAPPPEVPGQPDAPHQEEILDDAWWETLDAAPVGEDGPPVVDDSFPQVTPGRVPVAGKRKKKRAEDEEVLPPAEIAATPTPEQQLQRKRISVRKVVGETLNEIDLAFAAQAIKRKKRQKDEDELLLF